jgi:hypothetical protein
MSSKGLLCMEVHGMQPQFQQQPAPSMGGMDMSRIPWVGCMASTPCTLPMVSAHKTLASDPTCCAPVFMLAGTYGSHTT